MSTFISLGLMAIGSVSATGGLWTVSIRTDASKFSIPKTMNIE